MISSWSGVHISQLGQLSQLQSPSLPSTMTTLVIMGEYLRSTFYFDFSSLEVKWLGLVVFITVKHNQSSVPDGCLSKHPLASIPLCRSLFDTAFLRYLTKLLSSGPCCELKLLTRNRGVCKKETGI